MATKRQNQLGSKVQVVMDSMSKAGFSTFMREAYPIIAADVKASGDSLANLVASDGFWLANFMHASMLTGSKGRHGRWSMGIIRAGEVAISCGNTNKISEREIDIWCSPRGAELIAKFSTIRMALKAIENLGHRAAAFARWIQIFRENLATDKPVADIIDAWFVAAARHGARKPEAKPATPKATKPATPKKSKEQIATENEARRRAARIAEFEAANGARLVKKA